MRSATSLVAAVALTSQTLAAPVNSTSSASFAAQAAEHKPGYDATYVNYTGKAPPFPGNFTSPVLPTASGPPGPDDLLFQNLLAAEWVIYSFYQAGVEAFNSSSFTSAGYLNTTYSSIAQIRDNEAGHLSIFQSSISPTSTKPGPCRYAYDFKTPAEFLALQSLLEISSEAFLTGLAQQAQLNSTKGALVAIAETESRHNAWSLLTNFRSSAFVGPSDTVFPYANQILATTTTFIVNGSCPPENPPYPYPNQNLPSLDFDRTHDSGRPGTDLTLQFSDTKPDFKNGTDYYVVFFHGVNNASVPLNTSSLTVPIPDFDDSGLIIAVVADKPGATTPESVVAGPLFLLEQPAVLTKLI